MAVNPEADAIFYAQKDQFVERLKPLFLPDDPVSNDILLYFASLLRVVGMEDRGWDPYTESSSILNDLNRLMKIELPPFVGMYARKAGTFSPLVESDGAPIYTPLANGVRPVWPGDGVVP